MKLFKTFADYQDQTITFENGIELCFAEAIGLKVYARNTVYINKKKVELTDNDIHTLEIAKCNYFITRAYNDCSDDTIYYSTLCDEFKTSKRTHIGFSTQLKDELISFLQSININVIEI